jgi:hypothetical protein
MPLPILPVDSATSCSTHDPKLAIRGDATNVSLSRPLLASAPIRPPSRAPGLSATGTYAAHATAMRWASSTSASMSAPISAPGTSPKYETAE